MGQVTLTAATPEIFQTQTVAFTLAVENAPGSDLVVALQSSNPGILDVPGTVTIAGGSTSGAFTGTGILSGGPIVVTAQLGDDPTAEVTVLAPPEITLVAVTTSADQLSTGTLVWSGTATHAAALDGANATASTLVTGLTLGAPSITGDESAFTLEVPYTLAVDTLPGPATIVVDANGAFVGGESTTQVEVNRIPRLAAITPATATVDTTEVRGFSVVLDQSARPQGETVALAVSDGTKLTIPTMVVVTNGVSVPLVVTGAMAGGPVTVTGTLADSMRTSAVTVQDAIVAPQAFVQNDQYQGQSIFTMVTGTASSYVAIDVANFTVTPPAGLTITNATLTGNAGGWNLGFDVAVDAAATAGLKQIAFDGNGAVAGGMASIPFTVRELPKVASVGPDGTTVLTGDSANLTVVLTGPARAGNELVTLTVADAGVLTAPANVTVLAGTSSAMFSISGLMEGTTDVTATLNGVSDLTNVTVRQAEQGIVVISEVLSLTPGPQGIEIHNRTAAPIDIANWFIQIGTGPLHGILSSIGLADVTIPANGSVWGFAQPPAFVPNTGESFYFGAPGTPDRIAAAGDRVRIWSAMNVLQDEVDMRGMFVSDGAVALGASSFPGHTGRSTQLRSSLPDDMNLKDANNDGGNWCVTFRATNTLGAMNQACSEVVVNEVLYDAPSADSGKTFVELAGGGGTFIGGFRVEARNAVGTIGDSANVPTATRIPSDGFYVIADTNAGTTTVPNADLLDASIDPTNTSGSSLQLLDASLARIDAVQWGGMTVSTNGEGLPVALVTSAGESTFRDALSRDTNDNLADFSNDLTPSPGVGNVYNHTITIDGWNDFDAATEQFATTSAGYTAYYSWDETYFYFGLEGPDMAANDPFKWVIFYASGTNGMPSTTLGQNYGMTNPQRPTLAFPVTWHGRWRTSNNLTSFQRFTGGFPDWVESTVPVGGHVYQRGQFLEWRVPRADLFATARVVRVHLSMLNEQAGIESTWAGCPSTSFVDGLDPDYTKYFEFDLGESKAPNAYTPLP